MSWFNEAISRKKAFLAERVKQPLALQADRCGQHWGAPDNLDACLQQGVSNLPECSLIYVLDAEGIQQSSNVGQRIVEQRWRGQNLASRPYLQGTLPYQGFMLSSPYLSQRSLEPCISAVHAIRHGANLLGFLVADFELQALSLEDGSPASRPDWEQYKGDPAIRSTLFAQRRSNSALDKNIDRVIPMLAKMMTEHGVFHAKLHFSSSRATFWEHRDPYNYHLHSIDEIINPALCLVYPRQSYPENATVDAEQLQVALGYMKELRYADDTVYLRSGSLNIMNGMVGMNFSCDGSHYMPVEEFINKDLSFWFGG